MSTMEYDDDGGDDHALRRPLDLTFVSQLRRQCLHPECPPQVLELLRHNLFSATLTARRRLEGLQRDLSSSAAREPDFAFIAGFLQSWDIQNISDAAAKQVDDDSLINAVGLAAGDIGLYASGGLMHQSLQQQRGIPRPGKVGKLADPYRFNKPATAVVRTAPPKVVVEAPGPPVPSDPGVERPLRPDAEDCEDDHVFKGQAQPPVGFRLEHVLNFLADEDSYRCLEWQSHMTEIGEYLDDLSDGSEPSLGPKTRLMLDEARRRVKAHTIYENHVKDATVHVPPSHESVPRPEPRLRMPGANPPITLGPYEPAVLLPRRVLHRIPDIVNDMLEHYRGDFVFRLARAENELWKTPLGAEVPASNLSLIENAEYEADVRSKQGWVTTTTTKGIGGSNIQTRTLPDGTVLGNDAVSFARERGARRAGLQQCLRHFRNLENALAQTRIMSVVLPVPAAALEKAAANTAAVQFHPLTMRRSDLPPQLETHPYTMHMLEYRRLRTWWLDQARERVEEAHAGIDDGDWTRLPRCRDALVLQPPGPLTQQEQDLLRLMRAIRPPGHGGRGLLDRAMAVAPRPLLDDVQFWMSKGREGNIAALNTSTAPSGPSGLQLRVEFDWEVPGRRPKLVNETEVRWLVFLLTGSCSRGMASDLPFKKAALFLAFAERLQRLMDDPSEAAVFGDMDVRVPVEELVDIMNGAADGSATNKKAKFSVHDATYWLHRLHNFGRCRFTESTGEYGHVQRPVVDVHPEHLLLRQLVFGGQPPWYTREAADRLPDDEDDAVGAPRRLGELHDWAQAIRESRQNIPLHGAIHSFFCGLAFRFGYTYLVLHDRKADSGEESTSASVGKARKQLHRGLGKWDAMYDTITKAAGRHFTLADVVKRADPREWSKGMDETEAACLIRHYLVREAESALTPLHPFREYRFNGDDNQDKVVLRRPPVWDWALPEVRGRPRCYFSMDRWPVHLQRAETAGHIERGDDLDPRTLWDPCSEDTTPFTWYRQKPPRYSDEKVVFRRGPARFPIGDTKKQHQALVNAWTDKLAKSLGIEEERPSFFKRLSGMISFSRQDSPPAALVPQVGPSDMPRSLDRTAEPDGEHQAKQKRKAKTRALDFDGDIGMSGTDEE